jgi:hypothetical protein
MYQPFAIWTNLEGYIVGVRMQKSHHFSCMLTSRQSGRLTVHAWICCPRLCARGSQVASDNSVPADMIVVYGKVFRAPADRIHGQHVETNALPVQNTAFRNFGIAPPLASWTACVWDRSKALHAGLVKGAVAWLRMIPRSFVFLPLASQLAFMKREVPGVHRITRTSNEEEPMSAPCQLYWLKAAFTKFKPLPRGCTSLANALPRSFLPPGLEERQGLHARNVQYQYAGRPRVWLQVHCTSGQHSLPVQHPCGQPRDWRRNVARHYRGSRCRLHLHRGERCMLLRGRSHWRPLCVQSGHWRRLCVQSGHWRPLHVQNGQWHCARARACSWVLRC